MADNEQKDEPPKKAPTGARHAHHQADEAAKQAPRVLALKAELLLGPVLAFAVGALTIGGFLAYIGSGMGTVVLWGLVAGVVMAVGSVAFGAV